MTKITLVGCGLVGGSWSLVFARAGYDVTLYDPFPASIETAVNFARDTAPKLAAQGLLNGQEPDAVLARLKPVTDLAEAVRDADHIQESAPERLAVKQALYKEMTPLCKADAVIASSSSGLPPSSFSENAAGRERCLVAHPINPPHLIPLVEIVPAPWTAKETADKAQALMRDVGQAPIRLTRETPGFVVNRLQGAMLDAAFLLVEEGIVTATDVDVAMTEGLGLRWFFLGPFDTIDLNAQGGVADYCDKLAPMYYDLAQRIPAPKPWSGELVKTVESQLREKVPADTLEARKNWRDRCLAAFIKAKRTVMKENG